MDKEFPAIRRGIDAALEALETLTADAKRRMEIARQVLASYQLFTLEQANPGLIREVSGLDDVTAQLQHHQESIDGVDGNVRIIFSYLVEKERKQQLGLPV